MAHVAENTHPGETARRLHAGGPLGFILSVYETLRRLDRPYYYSAAVPRWLQASESEGERKESKDFASVYNEFEDRELGRRDFRTTRHCIIHRFRKYPAKLRFAGTSDTPNGARRQKRPKETYEHQRPLPASNPHHTKAFEAHHTRPPLWDSEDQVPDLIREYVDKDTVMSVVPWEYDVFVDFTFVAANMYLLHQMEEDLMSILVHFHERWATGGSNLSGYFVSSLPGSSPDLELRSDYPARTITWRLKQTQAYAFPSTVLEEIHMDMYNKRPEL